MAVYGEFCARSVSRLSALGCMHTFMSRLCSHANYEDSCKTAVSNKQQQYDYETSRNGSEAETRSEDPGNAVGDAQWWRCHRPVQRLK